MEAGVCVAEAGALLVVDDDRLQRLVVRRIAVNLGFDVFEAASVTDVRMSLERTSFAVAVVDLSLGDADGIECIRQIALSGHKPDILILSGHDDRTRDAVSRFCRAVGLTTIGDLRKPIDMHKLRKLLLARQRTTAESNATSTFHISRDDLSVAMQRDEIGIVYQPKVSVVDDRVIGAEALARWKSPIFGDVSPDVFCSIAETTDLAGPLTHYILQRACSDAVMWERHLPGLGIAVNVPLCVVADLSFPDTVSKALSTVGLAPNRLTLEIVETGHIGSNYIDIADVLARLRIRGVNLAIDDFGTGFSSLSSLLIMPYSELKIDRSFVTACDEDPYALKIVKASVVLAREFGMTCVAEGIETESVRNVLAEIGCDVGQGHYYSPGITASDVLIFATSRTSQAA